MRTTLVAVGSFVAGTAATIAVFRRPIRRAFVEGTSDAIIKVIEKGEEKIYGPENSRFRRSTYPRTTFVR